MASPSLPTLAEPARPLVEGESPRADWPAATATSGDLDVLVAGCGSPLAAAYADYVERRQQGSRVQVADLSDAASAAKLAATLERGRVGAILLFLKPRLTASDRAAIAALLRHAGAWGTDFVGVVSTFQIHLGDREAAEAETHVLDLARGLPARTVVFRPGLVLSEGTPLRLGFLYPLVPARLRGCCVDAGELFAAVESERQRGGRTRTFAIPGPNRSWREVLAQHRPRGPVSACLTAASALLSLLLVGHLAALVLTLLARRRPSLGRWCFDTLRPQSLGELRALCNPYSYRDVKVVGYNNGVIHFGHRYPGKTIVSTVHCNRVRRAGAGLLKADCGTTIRKALDFLAANGQELPVVPNYSYVCLGTAFFVPIHGSAADFSTVADTIVRVVLYDPLRDRILVANREDAAFRENVFNLRTDVLLLRMYVQAKPKARYYVHRETLTNPPSGALLGALSDGRAANAEIRKGSASSATVTVSRYYTDPGASPSPVLELPRDALGRLWDRLEENAITSFLMHALTRHFAWHVELFFTAEEFATFWNSHWTLPLRKLQFRYIRRDGMPHSPFRDDDCVSVDLFMLRRHQRRFESYLKRTFAVVRTNPGKHSR